MGSEKFKFNSDDVVGIVKTSVLVGAAAAVTYIADNLAGLDLGVMTGVIVPVVAVGLDSVIKWLKDNTK